MSARRFAALAAVLALAASACDRDKPADGAAPVPAPCGEAAAPRATSPAIATLLAAVPGDALALGFVDLPGRPWDAVTGGLVAPLLPDEQAALAAELKTYLGQRIGLDVSRAQAAVGYLAAPPVRAAVIVSIVDATGFVATGEPYAGGRIRVIDPETSVAGKGELLVVGTDAAVRQVLDTVAGQRGSVLKERPELVEWLRGQSAGAYLAVAVAASAGFTPPAPFDGLTRGAVAFGPRGLDVAVEGAPAALDALQAQAELALSAIVAQVEQARSAALAGGGDPMEGAGAILAAHTMRSLSKQVRPVREGNRLRTSLKVDLGAAATTLPMVGIVAAVAIPAFLKYQQRVEEIAAPQVVPPAPAAPAAPGESP